MKKMIIAMACILAGGCAMVARPGAVGVAGGHHNVVMWISVDGLRGDYVQRSEAPFLTRMTKEGAFTTQLLPVTPSITFASHSSEVTGVSVNGHGIPHNTLYVPETHEVLKFPSEQKWLLAEPIWTTAQRQGLRTAVLQWPLSNAQTGPFAASYFMPAFDGKISDAGALGQLLDVWEADTDPRPLQLLIGYVHDVDGRGHALGPDGPAILETVKEEDKNLSDAYGRALADFKARMQPGDEFYFLISTDHGMMQVTNYISAEALLAAPARPDVVITTSGPVADVYVDQVKDPAEKETLIAAMVAEANKQPYAKAYRRKDVPAEWNYNHPTRVGDIVVMLANGYTFEKSGILNRPVTAISTPRGMHGYPVSGCPEMMGFTAVLRYPDAFGGKNLGKVDSRILHATVAGWLHIKPADGAMKADGRW